MDRDYPICTGFDEKKYIDALGSHGGSQGSAWSCLKWLDNYIEVYKDSPHLHHQEGVQYARERREKIIKRGPVAPNGRAAVKQRVDGSIPVRGLHTKLLDRPGVRHHG